MRDAEFNAEISPDAFIRFVRFQHDTIEETSNALQCQLKCLTSTNNSHVFLLPRCYVHHAMRIRPSKSAFTYRIILFELRALRARA